MAAIVFPSPANVDDTHVVGDRTWKFNGTAWKIVPRTTDLIDEGTTNLYYLDSRVAAAPAVTGLDTRLTTAESDIDALETDLSTLSSSLTGLGNALNYVGTVAGGATANAAFDLSTLTEKDAGDYYKVSTGGWFVIGAGTAFFANIYDGLVWNLNGEVDKIDNTNSTVTGTSEEITVAGSPDTGYTVSIATEFSGRVSTAETNISTLQTDLDTAETSISTLQTDVTNLGTAKQIKNVVAASAPSHAEGLVWIDSTDMTPYLSYSNVWVELDKQ